MGNQWNCGLFSVRTIDLNLVLLSSIVTLHTHLYPTMAHIEYTIAVYQNPMKDILYF